MIAGFEFEDGGKKFKCSVEAPTSSPDQAWWWFTVSNDDRHRYAPFQAASSDTQKSVKTRILAYYASLLEARARPATTTHWGRRPAKPEVAGPQPTVAPK